jgi:hypothetical protein
MRDVVGKFAGCHPPLPAPEPRVITGFLGSCGMLRVVIRGLTKKIFCPIL